MIDRWWARALLVIVCVAALVASPPVVSATLTREPAVSSSGTSPSWAGVTVRGSPFWPDGAGERERVTVRLDLEREADIRMRIEDFDGRAVRTLIDGRRDAGTLRRRWDGRDESGRTVSAGPYRAVVEADDGSGLVTRDEAWVTLAESRVYARRPGFITIAVDPGHGTSDPGALARNGTREADLNLDVGLRLAAMLEGAGANVVPTRTSSADVNDPPVDRTFDGIVDETDELAARPDVANPARADLFIALHNNVARDPRVGGPSTFYSDERPWSDRSRRLAGLMQDEIVEKLRRFRTDRWAPYVRGPMTYPYYVLRGYDPPRLLRPTQMPAVLTEGLFLSNPTELRLLKRPRVRAAMAEAYYEAVARYLAGRGRHVGYELRSGPEAVAPGERASYEVVVRNAGTLPIRGWTLRAGAIAAPFLYEGRGRRGAPVGSARIPDLSPGEQARVRVPVTAPAEAGEWHLLFEALDQEDRRSSRLGSPPLQVPLQVLSGTAEASAAPSAASSEP